MILVTGSNGYLGSHVMRVLAERDMEHHGSTRVECDMTDRAAVKALIRDVRPATVIHCAAIIDYDSEEAADASVDMLQNVAAHALCPIVFASSMTAESRTHAYGRGKHRAEALLGNSDRIVRLPGLFGAPRRDGLVYNAARAFLAGERFAPDRVPGPWAAMHVEDAAHTLVNAVYDSRRLIGADGPFDVDAAISVIAHECGVAPAPEHEPGPIFRRGVRKLVAWLRAEPT